MFVYGPPLLLMGSPIEIALAVLTGSAGVTALAAATMGFARKPLGLLERAALTGSAVALIFPGLATDAVGVVVLLMIFSQRSD